MSATLTVYSTSSPRDCAIVAGATRTFRHKARGQIQQRMIVLLEHQPGGTIDINDRRRKGRPPQSPLRAHVAEVGLTGRSVLGPRSSVWRGQRTMDLGPRTDRALSTNH